MAAQISLQGIGWAEVKQGKSLPYASSFSPLPSLYPPSCLSLTLPHLTLFFQMFFSLFPLVLIYFWILFSGVPPSASGSKHTAPPTRRSYSQDSASQQVMEKSRSKSGGSKVAKKGSSHADVIDRLDFTSNASTYDFISYLSLSLS